MASVKKTMKSSETKQAKQPRTRNPKAKASKRAAEAKARQAAAARALAAKKLAAKKLAAKKLATKQLAAKKLVSKKPATKKLATKKSVQKVKTKTTVETKTKTKTAAAVSSRATSPAAKTKAPASTRALASGNSTASAAKKAVAAARRGKLTRAPPPAAKRAVATKPVEAVRLAATGKAGARQAGGLAKIHAGAQGFAPQASQAGNASPQSRGVLASRRTKPGCWQGRCGGAVGGLQAQRRAPFRGAQTSGIRGSFCPAGRKPCEIPVPKNQTSVWL